MSLLLRLVEGVGSGELAIIEPTLMSRELPGWAWSKGGAAPSRTASRSDRASGSVGSRSRAARRFLSPGLRTSSQVSNHQDLDYCREFDTLQEEKA